MGVSKVWQKRMAKMICLAAQARVIKRPEWRRLDPIGMKDHLFLTVQQTAGSGVHI
jgi:hypothetical protein